MGAILGQVAIVLLAMIIVLLLADIVPIGLKLVLLCLLGTLPPCPPTKDLCSEDNAFVRLMLLVDGRES